jgi:hypothetical protein
MYPSDHPHHSSLDNITYLLPKKGDTHESTGIQADT